MPRGVLLLRSARAEVADRSETGTSAADQAYGLWAEQFPNACREGAFFGRAASRDDISMRVQRLRAALGVYGSPVSEDLALRLVASRGEVLFAPKPRATFMQLALELTGQTKQGRGKVLAALQQKPGLLLVPPSMLSNKGRAVLDMSLASLEQLLEESQVEEDEPDYWRSGQNTRSPIIEIGKFLKPVGGAKALYPIVLLIFYLAACASDYLTPFYNSQRT